MVVTRIYTCNTMAENYIYNLYQCRYPYFDIIRWLCKVTTGGNRMKGILHHSVPFYITSHETTIYFKTKTFS